MNRRAVPERNAKRAERITKLAETYQRDVLGEAGEALDYTTLAGIVTDMRHWCAVNGCKWSDVLALAREHYEAETLGGE